MFLPTEEVIQSRTLEACKNNLLGNETLIVEEKCKAAVDENPKDDRAWYWYAHSQYRQGQFESAIAAWEKAASLGASKSNSYYNIALAEKQRGRLAEAIEAGTIAVEAANHKEPVARALAYDLLADAHAALWDEGKGPATHFKQAEKDYLLFLEIGRPKYRARARPRLSLRDQRGRRRPRGAASPLQKVGEALGRRRQRAEGPQLARR
jgi:tetratricopeptide (TPR) repeat protein